MRARLFFMVSVLVAVSTAASSAFARKGMSDDAQRRALLSQLAAASAEAPPQERTDADLMYEAMKQWHGEPRGGAAVDRALAQSKKEIRTDRKVMEEKIRAMFWKDPFSQEVVPVRQEDRDLLLAHAQRQASARANAGANEDEVSRLRAELASVRAEASRLRAELARAQNSDDVSSGRGDTVSASGECAPASGSGAPLQARRNIGASRSRQSAARLEALNMPSSSHSHHHSGSGKGQKRETAAVPEIAAPTQPETVAAVAPAGWQSSDPRGIIVVPLDTPVTIQADKPARAKR